MTTVKGTKYYKDDNLNETIAKNHNTTKRKVAISMKRTKQTGDRK